MSKTHGFELWLLILNYLLGAFHRKYDVKLLEF